MRISEILKGEKPVLSFEVFPPKTQDTYEVIKEATEEIAALKPAFMSVTYGAGGGTARNTIEIAKNITSRYQVTALAHLTCASAAEEEIKEQLVRMKDERIENILALRGDIPKGTAFPREKGFRYAYELIEKIREEGDFCIGGACYPEGHIEASSKEEDILHLKQKVDAGCDFLTTQMFFDNHILYNFLYRLRDKGIMVPVIAGIMPVVNGRQIKRICSLSGTYLPSRFRAMADRFGDNPEAMKQAGVAYATEQIIDLIANGVKAVHVYSMNRPDVARSIRDNLSDILKA